MATLLEIEDLTVEFRSHAGVIKAVDGISSGVGEGETVAIVGKFGCGKSMSALAVIGLVPCPPGQVGGAARFQVRDLLALPEDELRDIRGRDIAMVFQEPMTSLDPALSVGSQLVEGMRRHLGVSKAAAGERAIELLRVGRDRRGARRLKASALRRSASSASLFNFWSRPV